MAGDDPYIFPDVDALILTYLKEYFEDEDWFFDVKLPDDLDQKLPFVRVSRLPGGIRTLGIFDDSREDLEVRATTREESHDVMQRVLGALDVMWKVPHTGAIIYRADLEAAPGWVPDPVTRQPRWIATVSIRNRPKS